MIFKKPSQRFNKNGYNLACNLVVKSHVVLRRTKVPVEQQDTEC